MAAFVAILLLSNVIGAGKVAVLGEGDEMIVIGVVTGCIRQFKP